MIIALEYSGMEIIGDSIKTKLLQESSCLDRSKLQIDSDSAYHVKQQAGRIRLKQKLRKIKCWSCGKVELHFATECDEKKKEKKRTDQAKKEGESNSKVRFLASEIVTEENKAWIVDSTVSAQVSPNKSIFDSFVKFRESKVIVVDNTKLQAKGSGIVNISLLVNGEKHALILAEEVLYVSKFTVDTKDC